MTLRRLIPVVIFFVVFAAVLLVGDNAGQPRLVRNEEKPSASSTPESLIPTNTVATIYEQESLDEEPADASEEVLFRVTRVIDGDTIELEGGERVRYIGVDTPETKHPRKSVQCFGKEAARKNRELVLGKSVRLEKDVSERDKYGRLLRYVYAGNVFVNLEMVKQGYAYAATFPPDVKYQNFFLQAQREARAAERGLWGECK